MILANILTKELYYNNILKLKEDAGIFLFYTFVQRLCFFQLSLDRREIIDRELSVVSQTRWWSVNCMQLSTDTELWWKWPPLCSLYTCKCFRLDRSAIWQTHGLKPHNNHRQTIIYIATHFVTYLSALNSIFVTDEPDPNEKKTQANIEGITHTDASIVPYVSATHCKKPLLL